MSDPVGGREAEIEAALALLRELTMKHGQEDALNTIEDALDALRSSGSAAQNHEIEAVAEAIYNEHWQTDPWPSRVDTIQERYRAMARAALDAVRSSGSAAQNQKDEADDTQRPLKALEEIRRIAAITNATGEWVNPRAILVLADRALAERSPQDEDHEEADRV